MENLRSDHFHPTGFIEKKEIPTRKPEIVVGFLRGYNFCNRDESVEEALHRIVLFMEKRYQINERLLPGEPAFLDLLIDKLDESGFLESETISRKKWTKKTEKALHLALKNFENHNPKWKERVGKEHEDWRV
jgi:hypothetical protein